MIVQQTLTQLRNLSLDGMAHAFEEQITMPSSQALPFEDRFAMLVEREAVAHAYLPLLACVCRAPSSDAAEWLWRGAFPVPPDLACDPRALFAVRLRDDVLLALPRPEPSPLLLEVDPSSE